MEEEDYPKISLKFSKTTVSSIVCTMKIPNFSTLPDHEKHFQVYSSPFQFADSIWRFRFSASDNLSETTFAYFTANLIRVSSEIAKQKIFSSIILLHADDTVYFEGDRKCHFENDIAKMGILPSPQTYDERDSILTMIIHLVSSEIEVESDQGTLIPHKGLFLRQDFKDLLLNGQDHNIKFNVCGKEFKAHRDILQARSEYFRSMFSQDMLDKKSIVIDVHDCDPQTFEQFLFYVYTEETSELNEQSMFGLYYIANKYNFAQLKEKCRLFIKMSLSVTNIRDTIELAAKHSEEGLMNFAMSYFIRHADVVWPSNDWQLFMKENYVVANEFIAKSLKKMYDRKAKRLKIH